MHEGLLIKELLFAASKEAKAVNKVSPLVALTRGIVFLGTPHFGATSANTIIEMKLAKSSPTLEYLKPKMHFHELQNWFESTNIEYINAVENMDITSHNFVGIRAKIVMKFIGLRLVQVNDGMISIGSGPSKDLSVSVRHNVLVDLDHWAIGNK